MLRIIKRELKIVWSDWRLTVMIFAMPVLYTALLGNLYAERRVTRIPAYIVDQDNSLLSRSVANAVSRNETLRFAGYLPNLDEFRTKVIRREGHVCFVIPKNFERDVKDGRKAKLLSIIDGSNLLLSNSAYKAATTISQTFSVGVLTKKLTMKGTPGEYALPAAMPIESVARVWYIPSFEYFGFIMLGLVGTVVQQIALIGVALAYARERQHGLIPGIFKITSRPLEVLATKAILYTAINLSTAFAAYALTIYHYHVKIDGSMLMSAMLLGLFIFTIVALGVCVSTLCKDELFATEILMLMSLPSFLLSGFTWPVFAMTPVIKFFNWILPLSHFINPLRAIATQNGTFADIRGDVLWMWAVATISYVVAYLVVWSTMAAAKRRMDAGLPPDCGYHITE